MRLRDLRLHPDFPDKVWVVVEQPARERYRLEFDPATEHFIRTAYLALSYSRGWSGAYGWVGGLGTPPEGHTDVYLVTRKPTQPGDIMAGCVCGVFFRSDGDHKLVALDADLIDTVERADIACLDRATLAELYALYPVWHHGEGWFGVDQARAYLKSLPGRH